MAAQLVPLGELNRGARGVVHSIDDSQPISENLRDMGFEETLAVEILHQSPIGRDPIAVQIGTMTVALRRKDANVIMVELS